MSTLDLLNAIVDKNSTEIFETFEQEMSARILDRLDDRRIEVAQSLFKESLDEAVEEKPLSYKERRKLEIAGNGTQASKSTRTISRGLTRQYGKVAGVDVEDALKSEKPVRATQKYGARKPAAPIAKPEQGSTDGNTQYVSGTDKSIWEKLGGVGDLAEHFPEKNLNIHHEISHTDSQGNQHSFKVLGSDAKSILDLHKHMTTMGKSTMSARQHMLDFFEKKPTTESVKVLAQKARDIMSKSSPSLQTNSLEHEGNLVNEEGNDLKSMALGLGIKNLKIGKSSQEKEAEEMKRREERDKRYASGELKPASVKPTSGSFGDTRGYGQGRYMGD